MSNQYQKLPPKQLTPEDKTYIKLLGDGDKNTAAFREAYPDHKAVVRWHDTRKLELGDPLRVRANDLLMQAAKNKLLSEYMSKAMTTYTDSMEKYSELSLETAIDLVQNARSEKVRADLAIEGIRHKIGTPVQKVAVQEQKTVHISFGKPTN